MKMHMSLSLAAGFAALLVASAASAADARPIDQRRPLKADAEVEIENIAGSIEVEAWDRKEFHLTGTLAPEVEELIVEGDESHLRIEVQIKKRKRNVGDTHLKLKVPAGVELEASAVSADIRIKGIKGPVEAVSVSGDVTLDVGSARVEAQSVSGDVQVQAPFTDIRAETVSGNVTLRGGKGDVHSESVSGTIDVKAREVRRLEAESVSGDLRFDIDLAKNAEVSVETLSGEVEFTLPSLPDIDVDIHTFSGDVESAFALTGARGDGKGHGDEDEDHDEGGRHWRREGKDKGRLDLQSFSGDITLKKK